MKRRALLKGLGLTALGATTFGGAMIAYRSGRNPYYNGPITAHFDGLRFHSPGRKGEPGKSPLDLLRWNFGGGKVAWPKAFPSPFQDKPPARVESGIRVTLIGHASFLVQVASQNILIDPVYSRRASPVTFAGPMRVNDPGITFDDLPKIDAILITHNHYDHLDVETVARLHRRDKPRIVVPLGNDAILAAADPALSSSEAHDWGTTIGLGGNVKVTLEPTLHWSARGMSDRFMALWASFVIDTPAGRIFACGDTGYDPNSIYPELGRRYGGFRLALLPIGAYEPRWFMKTQHMNPEEAVTVFRELQAEVAIGHHWGTFGLTNEGIEEPPAALDVALKAGSIAADRFRPFRPGQTLTLLG
jgi:L-ascorbate metabolism protein UlaG (beta-lactamase superfamily)